MEENILKEEMAEEFVDISELISSMTGFDKDHLSNTSLAAVLERWNEEGEVQSKIAQTATRKANVLVQRHGEYIQCELEFDSHTDKDLNHMWQILETFGKELDKMEDENTASVPIFILSLVPEQYDGKYYVTGMNPIFWNIQSSRPSSLNNNVLRMQFLADQFMFYKTDAIDTKEIANDVEREESYRIELELRDAVEQEKKEEVYERRRDLGQLN